MTVLVFLLLDCGARKFGDKKIVQVSRLMDSDLLPPSMKNVDQITDGLEKLVLYSKSKNTWQKHTAAWNLLEKFSLECDIKIWPLCIKSARAFVVWSLDIKKLRSATVKHYLYSIKLAHSLGNMPQIDYVKDNVIQMCLKGAENIDNLVGFATNFRPAMDMNSLHVLGHRINQTTWSKMSKQVVWTACLISFFTSCRMGEILSVKEKSFDPCTTFMWKHVYPADEIGKTVYVPYTKTEGLRGKNLDLFHFNVKSCCPILAIEKLEKLAKQEGTYNPEKPVLTFRSGKYLTVKKLNEILKELLLDLSPDGVTHHTCHSFRAAIPTLLSAHPNNATVKQIKEWGGWDSDSFKKYVKSDKNRKKEFFGQITVFLNDN